MNLIAELGIFYVTLHNHIGLNISCYCCRTALTTIYKHKTGRGVGNSLSVVAAARSGSV